MEMYPSTFGSMLAHIVQMTLSDESMDNNQKKHTVITTMHMYSCNTNANFVSKYQ